MNIKSEELIQEAENLTLESAQDYIPQLCRTLRDEYDSMEARTEYTDKDEPKTPEEQQELRTFHIRMRNDYVKLKILYEMQGILFNDRVVDGHGQRLLPRAPGKYLGTRLINDRDPQLRYRSIKVYSRAKDMSKRAKLVEQLIDKEIACWKE